MECLIGYFDNLSLHENDWNTMVSFEQQPSKRKISQWDISKLYPSTLLQYLSYHTRSQLRLGLR